MSSLPDERAAHHDVLAQGVSMLAACAPPWESSDVQPDLRGRRVLLVINTEWYFLLHWLELARALRTAGADVTVMTADERGKSERITAEGFTHVVWRLHRRSLNPARELAAIVALLRAYRRIRPHVVHHVTIKPVIYGTLVARILGLPVILCTVPGLGYMLSGGGMWGHVRRVTALALYRLTCRSRRVRMLFQNVDDRAAFVDAGIVHIQQTAVIPGVGVDIDRFVARPEPLSAPVVLFASRLLWDKGVGEFVEMARRLRAAGIGARFVIAGSPDCMNPNSVPDATVAGWVDEGVVEWWGERDDMPAVLPQSHVVVLPVRVREGLPAILAEAAACGRAVVTTSVPGCRDVVIDGVTGVLVEAGDRDGLVNAVASLLAEPNRRARYGAAARLRAETVLAQEHVVRSTLALYADATIRHAGA